MLTMRSSSITVAGIVAILLVLFASHAYAYIDPGTGSVIYTSIAAMIGIGAGVVGAILWPLRRFIRKLRNKSNDSNSSDSLRT